MGSAVFAKAITKLADIGIGAAKARFLTENPLSKLPVWPLFTRERGRVRPTAWILGTVLALVSAAPAASVVITSDKGGQIGAYVARYGKVRQRGERVVIDGVCLSACTIVVGMIPPERLCATRNAVLGFHAAWLPDGEGRMRPSREGTEVLMKFLSAEPPSMDRAAGWTELAARGAAGTRTHSNRSALRGFRGRSAHGTRCSDHSSAAEPACACDDRADAERRSRHCKIGIGPEHSDACQPHFRRGHNCDGVE